MRKRALFISLMVCNFVFPSCSSSTDYNVSIEGFTLNNDTFNGKVDNEVSTYSFTDKVSLTDNFTWKIYNDPDCTDEIVSKTIECKVGENTIHMLFLEIRIE